MLNEVEARKLSDFDFKMMLIKMLNELSKNYKECQERYKKLIVNYTSMKKGIEIINESQEEPCLVWLSGLSAGL